MWFGTEVRHKHPTLTGTPKDQRDQRDQRGDLSTDTDSSSEESSSESSSESSESFAPSRRRVTLIPVDKETLTRNEAFDTPPLPSGTTVHREVNGTITGAQSDTVIIKYDNQTELLKEWQPGLQSTKGGRVEEGDDEAAEDTADSTRSPASARDSADEREHWDTVPYTRTETEKQQLDDLEARARAGELDAYGLLEYEEDMMEASIPRPMSEIRAQLSKPLTGTHLQHTLEFIAQHREERRIRKLQEERRKRASGEPAPQKRPRSPPDRRRDRFRHGFTWST